jgi:hypothetical protein
METRLRLPHSLSPRPMRRTHKTGSEEPQEGAVAGERAAGPVPRGRRERYRGGC